MKVLFTSHWRNSKDELNLMKKLTPNNSGKWKDLEGSDDINNFDYIVVLDNINKEIEIMGQEWFENLINGNYDKIIHFQRENTEILKQNNKKTWYIRNIFNKLSNKFLIEEYKITLIYPSFIDKDYDYLKNLKYEDIIKNKSISSITSSKCYNFPKSIYNERKKLLTNISKKYTGKIDIFGRGWDVDILGKNYKGELGNYHQNKNKVTTKFDGLISYDYSICLENFTHDGCLSEKLTDAILCWTIPIYLGNKERTKEYIPEKSYILIDLNEEETFNKINKIINLKPTEEELVDLKIARNLILDKYNIWENIYMIINHKDKYLKDYIYKYI